MTDKRWTWEIATDARAIHRLISASDRHQGVLYASPIPVRRFATTIQSVQSGTVHLLRYDDEPAATMTVTTDCPFPGAESRFTPVVLPVYLQRLAVHPPVLGLAPLTGARCVRRALETARGMKADALRCEANPDLKAVFELLRLFEFRQVGEVVPGPMPRAYLERLLDTASPR